MGPLAHNNFTVVTKSLRGPGVTVTRIFSSVCTEKEMAFEKAHSKGNVQNSPLLNVEAGGRFCQLDIYSAYTEVEMQSLTDIMFYIR